MRQSNLLEVLLVTLIIGVMCAIVLQSGFLFFKPEEPQVTVSPDYYQYYGMVHPDIYNFAEQDTAHVIPYTPAEESD